MATYNVCYRSFYNPIVVSSLYFIVSHGNFL